MHHLCELLSHGSSRKEKLSETGDNHRKVAAGCKFSELKQSQVAASTTTFWGYVLYLNNISLSTLVVMLVFC